MKLWIDDVRQPPVGYIWATMVDEAICIINHAINNNEKIDVIDIDHDAGDYVSYGGDYINILNYMEEKNINDIPIHIHSMNLVGVDNMRRIIQRNGWKEI